MTILDIFTFELKFVPDSSYVRAETEINESGDELINYRKNLNYKELGLFDTIEIKVFKGKPNKNFVFSNFNFLPSEIADVQKLIDTMFLYYGLDSLGLGKFNQTDLMDINDGYWSGRMWTDEKYKNPAMISFDDEYGLTMTLWLTE